MNAPVTIAVPTFKEITTAARLLLIEDLTDDSNLRDLAWRSMDRALTDWAWEHDMSKWDELAWRMSEAATDCIAALFTIAENELIRRDAAAAEAVTDDERYMDLMAQRADARRAT